MNIIQHKLFIFHFFFDTVTIAALTAEIVKITVIVENKFCLNPADYVNDSSERDAFHVAKNK